MGNNTLNTYLPLSNSEVPSSNSGLLTVLSDDELNTELVRRENQKLKQESEEKDNRIRDLEKLTVNQALKIMNQTERILDLETKVSNGSGNYSEHYHYAISPKDWKSKDGSIIKVQTIESLCDQLYDLCLKEHYDGSYYVKNRTCIVPIYLVLSSSKILPLVFVGNLPDFEQFWNYNIAYRLKEQGKRDDLKCNHKSVRDAKNKSPWIDCEITSWRRLADDSRYSKVYSRPADIKKEIESFRL